MKTSKLTTTLGALAIAGSLFVAVPTTTFAASVNAAQSSSFRIGADGLVTIIGAEVTSVSGNIVNAVTRFKDTVINWAFTTNASTKIAANGNQATSTTQDLHVGDKLTVTGTLTSVGSTFGVTANKIADLSALASWKMKNGTVQSVNTSNGTFTMVTEGKTVTVVTNSSTSFKLTTGTSTSTLANLAAGAKVVVYGTMSADGSTLTATKVLGHGDGIKKEVKEDHKELKKNANFVKNLKSHFGFHFGK